MCTKEPKGSSSSAKSYFSFEEEGADVRVRVCPDTAEREGAEGPRPLYPVVDLPSSRLIEGLPIRGDFSDDVRVQVHDVWECPKGMGRPEEVA